MRRYKRWTPAGYRQEPPADRDVCCKARHALPPVGAAMGVKHLLDELHPRPPPPGRRPRLRASEGPPSLSCYRRTARLIGIGAVCPGLQRFATIPAFRDKIASQLLATPHMPGPTESIRVTHQGAGRRQEEEAMVFSAGEAGKVTDPFSAVESVATSLLDLLDLAGLEIEHDAEKAKLTIRRSSSILRIELERRTGDLDQDASMGGLAAWQVGRVRAYIDEHLSGRIHVKDLGAVARRSTAHFCRAFKQTTGETPHSYITRRRVARAEHLMLASD